MQDLNADYQLWALTWDQSPQQLARGDVPYFNLRTGALAFGWRGFDPTTDTTPDADTAEAEILTWPAADRERVPLFADKKEAELWLEARGFAVMWGLSPL